MVSRARLLAIDTATEACSVALTLDGANQIDQLLQITKNGHSDLVLDMVNHLLRKHSVELRDLDAVAVDVGPGSFTGLRIGIGVAQGLAYGAGLAAIGVGSLGALAAQCPDGFSIPAIDARMKQIYWGVFNQRGGAPEPLAGPFVTSPDDVHKMLMGIKLQSPDAGITHNANVYSIGSGWDQYRNSLPNTISDDKIIGLVNETPQALQIAKLAMRAEPAKYCSPLQLAASYVRNEVAKPQDPIQHKT